MGRADFQGSLPSRPRRRSAGGLGGQRYLPCYIEISRTFSNASRWESLTPNAKEELQAALSPATDCSPNAPEAPRELLLTVG